MLFPVLLWGASFRLTKFPVKKLHIAVAHLLSDISHCQFGPEQKVSGLVDPLALEMFHKALPCLLLQGSGEIYRMEAEGVCRLLQGTVPVTFFYKTEDFPDGDPSLALSVWLLSRKLRSISVKRMIM